MAIFRKLFSKKILIIARESNVVSINNQKAKFPVFYNWLCKKYYRKLDFIICQCQYMQADLLKNYHIQKEKTAVINNPVEAVSGTNEPSLQNSVTPIRKFITVARFSAQKGINRLLHAVAQLPRPFVYFIIGDGEEAAVIKNLIVQLCLQNEVFVEGQKTEPFKGHEDADLFLMGSYFEGFPNSLLEAGVLGIPVIAFDAPGGIGEIITDGKNGLLVKDNDENAFAQAIEKAQQINFSRPQIKAFTEQKFAVNTIVKKTEDLLLQQYSRHITKSSV
jgi:glycosyltransferase involved in cell wall biosynthesis